jgi:hypothetical protein
MAQTVMTNDPTRTTPAPSGTPAAASSRDEIAAFVQRARTLAPPLAPGQQGRLIFALDATMSRQPTWDMACHLQAEMFREAASLGGLAIQLVYYRGFKECRASSWVSDPQRLTELMGRIDCRGGHTQIGRVLSHAQSEMAQGKVQTLVFVGDAMEESVDDLAAAAGKLGLLGVPVLMFQEGTDAVAERAFREIARLTCGAYCRFDTGAADTLRELLRAAAVFASGGIAALTNHPSGAAPGGRLLLDQLR